MLTPQLLFDKSIEALGGSPVATKVLSITGIADCVSPRGPYVTELYSARPDRLLFKQIHSGREPFVAVINGAYAWSTDSATHAVHQHDPRTAAVIYSHDVLMLPLVWLERYKQFAVAPVTNFAGKLCVALNATDDLGLPCALYFDANTYRMVGLTFANPLSPEATVQIVFTVWQPCHTLLLPSTVVMTDSTGDFVFVFREVSLNALDEQIFAIPAEIKKP